MNSLSTAYPQVINWFTIALLAWTILAPIAVAIYCKLLFLRDFPGKRTINDLRIEISDFSGMVADLTERFARFQNKEGMRAAREAKQQEKTVLQQAQEIADQAGSETGDDKVSLYRRRRPLQ